MFVCDVCACVRCNILFKVCLCDLSVNHCVMLCGVCLFVFVCEWCCCLMRLCVLCLMYRAMVYGLFSCVACVCVSVWFKCVCVSLIVMYGVMSYGLSCV